ncbi:zinc finger MYM-type protein 1-like [Hydractinia symbiolongicarpus]|uniref:zinc finger MYM-type protein 1-like n=1 Tax=Hydractinia symbiolongicarpus TaxID=13093 RepID=UPI00254EBE24|nr:zinc finger MYM-type protein 1-like [Hydractinia symbiolongicarpus]
MRSNHFVVLLPLPTGKRKLAKHSLTLVSNLPNIVAEQPSSQKAVKKNRVVRKSITSYFSQNLPETGESSKSLIEPSKSTVEQPTENKSDEKVVEVDHILEADVINMMNTDDSVNDGALQFPEVNNENIDSFDLGNLVNNVAKMKVTKKLAFLNSVWMPDKNFHYPTSNRRFIHSWLTSYPWLCYSKIHDGAFCINCVMFHNNSQNVGKMEKLCKEPLRDWKNAKALLEKHHHKSPHHKNFKATMASTDTRIDRQLNNIVHVQITKNRVVLKSLIKILITMAQQCISLRGRDETDPTAQFQSKENVMSNLNPGNFLAFVKLAVELECPALKEHMSNCAKNATYLSKTIQNELLSLIAKNIVTQVVAQIKRSKYFSVLGDEAVDISNKEQMPVVLRYIDSKDEIRETFLEMAECKLGCSGKGLSNTIIDAVEQNNLGMNDCRGQGYDGAGAMAGKCSGASTLIKSKFPKAIYVHCASHRLNLCVAAGCKLPMVADMMSQFQAVEGH